ncbi:hypothetical protein ABIF36_006821 [Bradyrhizobium japonicum]
MKHHARLVAAADEADRVEQHSRAVEIDAVALVEIEFGLARDDRGEMEDRVRASGDQLFGRPRHGEIARHRLDRKTGLLRLLGLDHVVHGQLGDLALAEPAVAQQPFAEFTADHAGGAQNQNVQELNSFLLAGPRRS